MATTNSPLHKIATIPRFTVQDDYQVWSVDVLDTGRLAVAGHSNENTFIDLFRFNSDPVSQENPLLLRPEPYFSKIFTEFGSGRRSVRLLDDRLFLTCCKDTIALYDSSSNGDPVNQMNFAGTAMCMTTRDDSVYVGLQSTEVIVFDARELREGVKKRITLTGLDEFDDCLRDITVSKNKLFICTGSNGRAYMCNSEGEMEQKYQLDTFFPWSITVSEEKGLIFILWLSLESKVVVYSLTGGLFLASFEVPKDSKRIRINNNINRSFLVTRTSGEVYEYHTSGIFTFDNHLKFVKQLTKKDHCQELIDHFEVSAEESEVTIESDAPFTTLFHHLREARMVSDDAFSHLLTACSDKGLRKLSAVKQLTELTEIGFKERQLKALENKRQELSDKLAESEKEIQKLRDELNTMKALLQRENA